MSKDEDFKHPCSRILAQRGFEWIQACRANFVASDGSSSSRCRLDAGRTGTRLNIGRPQNRWCEAITIADHVLSIRAENGADSHVTIGTVLDRISSRIEFTNSEYESFSFLAEGPGGSLTRDPSVSSNAPT